MCETQVYTLINIGTDVIGDDVLYNSPVITWSMCYTGLMMAYILAETGHLVPPNKKFFYRLQLIMSY